MIIAATSTFALGPFTVHVRPRFDNPAWAVYIVMLHEKLIGKQFSVPIESDCRWLEIQHMQERAAYAPRPCYGIIYSTPAKGLRRRFATAKNGTKR